MPKAPGTADPSPMPPTKPPTKPTPKPTREYLGPKLLRAIAPSAVSLTVHLVLLALLASVTLTLSLAPDQPAPATILLDPINRTAAHADEPSQADANPAPFRVARAIDPITPPPVAQTAPNSPTPAIPRPRRIDPPAAERVTTAAIEQSVRARLRTIDFAGVATRAARSVVFVVDASGAMTTSMPFVLAELERSLADLGPTQRFQVVVFRDLSAIDASATQPAMAFGNGQLLEPTPAVRAAVASWLDSIKLGGRSTPLPGLELALGMQPDAIFLLSRSIRRTQEGTWDLGPDALLDRLRRLNPADRAGQRRTRIHAVQFIDPDPTGLMPRLAEIHGGPGAFALRSLAELDTLSKRPPAIEADAALDRALASLARLASTGSDLFVLYGLPTPEQRLRAAQAAAGALANLPASNDQAAIVRVLRARALRLMGEPVELTAPAGGYPDSTTQTLAALAIGSAPSFVPRSADPLVRAEAAIARVRWAQTNISERVADARDVLRGAGLDGDAVWQLVLLDAAARAYDDAGDPTAAQRALEGVLSIGAIGTEAERVRVLEHRLDLLLTATGQPARPGHAKTAYAKLVAAERALAAGDRRASIELLRAVEDEALRPRAQARLAELLSVGGPSELLEAARLQLADSATTATADDIASLARQAEQATATGSPDRPAVIAAYADILKAVLTQQPEHAAFWRSERSRIALEQAAALPPMPALDLLATIDPGTADPQAVLAAIDAAINTGTTTGPAVDRAIALLDRWDTPSAIRARRSRAAELATTSPDRAEAIYRELLAFPASHLPDRDIVTLDLAALLLRQGQLADAFGLAMPIAQLQMTPTDALGWRAWTLALEAIGKASPANAETRSIARAHLLRLRSADPTLGGGPWADRLASVERALAP